MRAERINYGHPLSPFLLSVWRLRLRLSRCVHSVSEYFYQRTPSSSLSISVSLFFLLPCCFIFLFISLCHLILITLYDRRPRLAKYLFVSLKSQSFTISSSFYLQLSVLSFMIHISHLFTFIVPVPTLPCRKASLPLVVVGNRDVMSLSSSPV